MNAKKKRKLPRTSTGAISSSGVNARIALAVDFCLFSQNPGMQHAKAAIYMRCKSRACRVAQIL